jgi:hypothetical protein
MAVRATQTFYRGFRIYTFRRHSCWKFSASPMTPDLPILSRYIFESEHETESMAIAEAKSRIDLLLGPVMSIAPALSREGTTIGARGEGSRR